MKQKQVRMIVWGLIITTVLVALFYKRVQNNFLVWAIAALFLTLGNLITRGIIKLLRKNANLDIEDKYKIRQSNWLGVSESVIYALAYWAGYPQFIVAWLGIKALGRWSSNSPGSVVDTYGIKDETLKVEMKVAEVNTYHIGNLLSILTGVLVGVFLKWLADGYSIVRL